MKPWLMILPVRFLGVTFSLVIASAGPLPAATLVVSQDSYIDGRIGFLDSNYGTTASVQVGQTTGVNSSTLGGPKSYFLFDATGLAQLSSVNSFSIQRSGSSTITRTIKVSAILGDAVDGWSETSITWNNAPGNNVAVGNRDFAAFAGETVIELGTFSSGGVSDTIYNFTIGPAFTSSLLDALNNGDRKLTLGLSYNSSQNSSVSFRSSESAGSWPLLDVTFVPEPAAGSLLLCGAALLLGTRSRKGQHPEA